MPKLSKADNAKKLVQQMVNKEGAVKDFAKKIGISYPVIYTFLKTGYISYNTADKILHYCRKNRLKISMSDIKVNAIS